MLHVTQDGVKETGVSLVYTVRALDAGPIISYERVEVDDHIKVCYPIHFEVIVYLDSNMQHKCLACLITKEIGIPYSSNV